MTAPLTGNDCKLYRNTGTYASPTWGLIAEIEDVSIADMSLITADIARRANGFKKVLAAEFDVFSIEFKLWHGLGATQFDDLIANYFAKTVEEYAIVDGPIATTGTQGLRIPILLTEFPWDQALESASSYSVKGKCAYMVSGGTEVDPEWYVVS